MSSMNLDTSSHEDELLEDIAHTIASIDDECKAAQLLIDRYGLRKLRDNLSGNGYRVVGKFIED